MPLGKRGELLFEPRNEFLQLLEEADEVEDVDRERRSGEDGRERD